MAKTDDILDLFNCVVLDKGQMRIDPDFEHLNIGVVTDFIPTDDQSTLLREHFKPLDITTLFTREERENASLEHLLGKQILHYIEVYGLDAPGLFDLECSGGEIVVLRFVEGIAKKELELRVRNLLYANAPIQDAEQLKRIIVNYKLDFNINMIQNNEMRCVLFRPGVDTFDSGDDVVRYLCYAATGETLLIKSKEVIAAVKKIAVHSEFFTKHELALAEVFNRHKRLILAAKRSNTRSAINRIARLSKTLHVPVKASIAKTFVHMALTPAIMAAEFDPDATLHYVSVRDKFKYLNILAQKRLQSTVDTFKIRNGKVFTRLDRRTYDLNDINRVESAVLESLAQDLMPLKRKVILLDKKVDYGLPVSRKQAMGNLPFGTQVHVDGNEISSGMYWKNEWGASDLDLSTIDMEGHRVGWGNYSGYTDRKIVFSGDLTSARNGAMEFMTSRAEDYSLFVNIFTGEPGAKMELVVGSNGKDRWIKDTIIREKHTLNSKNNIIGFVKDKTFTVYAGRLNMSRISGGENPILNQSKVDFWTVRKLLGMLGITFDVDREENVVYDHDLSYSSFSFDKVEDLLIAT